MHLTYIKYDETCLMRAGHLTKSAPAPFLHVFPILLYKISHLLNNAVP